MPNIIEADCKYPGGEVQENKNGKYRDAVFTLDNGDEVRVFGDEGSKEFLALTQLQKGETYTLIHAPKDSGYDRYELQDDDVEYLHRAAQNGGGGNGSGSSGSSGGGRGGSVQMDKVDAVTDLTAYVYKRLDASFADADMHAPPTSEEISKMTNTIAMTLSDHA